MKLETSNLVHEYGIDFDKSHLDDKITQKVRGQVPGADFFLNFRTSSIYLDQVNLDKMAALTVIVIVSCLPVNIAPKILTNSCNMAKR